MSESSHGPYAAHRCAESEHHREEANNLRALMRHVEASGDRLAEQVEFFKVSNGNLSEEIEDLRAQLAKVRADRDTMIAVYDETEARLATAEAALVEARRERDEARARRRTLNAAMDAALSDLRAARENYDTALDALRSEQQFTLRLVTERDAARQAAKAAEERAAKAEAQLAAVMPVVVAAEAWAETPCGDDMNDPASLALCHAVLTHAASKAGR